MKRSFLSLQCGYNKSRSTRLYFAIHSIPFSLACVWLRKFLSVICASFILCLSMVLIALPSAYAESLMTQVTQKYSDTTQSNKSVIRQWEIKTPIEAVTNELNGILNAYRSEIANGLEAAGNKTTKSSRLDLDIRYSPTGDDWMSFLASAKVTFHRKVKSLQIQSRTYNLRTGTQVELTDLFDTDEAWNYLKEEVRTQIMTYFPGEALNDTVLEEALANIEEAEFTLHAMSLVLHYPAERFYEGRHTLLEVTIMYPDLEPYMTDFARQITDNSDKKMIALTYDDGPMRTQTTKLLNKLKALGARATFFLIGNRIEKEMDLVQREHDDGHAIAAHNWTHAAVTGVSARTLRTYRAKFDAALIKAIGIPSRYDRVPHGLYPQMIKAQAGWPYIQWSIDTYDWRGRKPHVILNNIRNEVSDGDIVLFHDIKDLSADIAEYVIPFLIDEGFMLVTIDELFARDGITLENEKVYYRCINGDTSKK